MLSAEVVYVVILALGNKWCKDNKPMYIWRGVKFLHLGISGARTTRPAMGR